MTDFEEINKIEIRSEEVQEILGATPKRLISYGISVIFFVIIAVIIGSWFFKYPDIITSEVTLTTQNPPASLQAFSSGKITQLFVSENQNVKQDKVIAVIENTADFKHVLYLKSVIDTLKDTDNYTDSNELNIGDIQSYYSNLLRQLKDYRNIKELDYYNEKIKAVEQQINDYNIYYSRLLVQSKLETEELEIAKTQFERDKLLYDKKVHSKAEYENAEKIYLQQKMSYENAQTSLANTQMQINQLKQDILDLKLQKIQEENQKENAIDEALQNLKSQINRWEQNYLIKTPINGEVTLTKIWSKYQYVQTGEIVATVIPKEHTKIIGKAVISASGVGKVKPGQSVNIKLNNFPYMEFGLIRAKVKNISLVPVVSDGNPNYIAELELPSKLVSNYGREIKFSQEMTGTAEIITEDKRLLERFLEPLKSVWEKSVVK